MNDQINSKQFWLIRLRIKGFRSYGTEVQEINTDSPLTLISAENSQGKTATAEKYTNGKVDNKRNITSFVGVFPADAPQYTILVVLDEPQATEDSWGWKTAAWNAVPTTGKILDSILPLLFE